MFDGSVQTMPSFLDTVTIQVAVWFPSLVFTVILAVPSFIAVTFPAVSTVAIWVLSLFQVTFLFVAFVGFIVAVNVAVSPTLMSKVDLFKLTDVTLLQLV